MGKLVFRKPWPSMRHTVWGDKASYKKTYWSEIKGMYFAGDGARRDKDDYFWITGRIDDVRHGTTTLFAALNVADGTLLGQCQNRHRPQEWLKFLQQIDAETPADRDLHLILDNYATHKHPKVKQWLAKHPRFHLHFTPTSASWLNMVERFFRDLTVNRLRRGVFHSVPELVAALEKYMAQHNRAPKPFIWTAKANDILAKVARARKKLSRKHASR